MRRSPRLGVLTMVLLGVVASRRSAGGADAGTAGTAAAEPHWKALRSASASATSFLQNDWNRFQENYHPSYVLDENPETAWVEGVEGDGENQAITLPLSPVSSARALRLRIWNGYQKSRALWHKNAMPRQVKVTVLDVGGREVVTRPLELKAQWGAQAAVIDLPPRRSVAAVRITIASVYPGTQYRDTCISDVLVDVDSDVPYNAVAENGKRAALKAWVVERRQAAACFATKPPEFPFAFTKFVVSDNDPVNRSAFKKQFAESDALRGKLGDTRYRGVIKKPVRSGPDGLDYDAGDDMGPTLSPSQLLQLFSLDRVALFETKDQLVSHQKGEYEEHWTTAYRAARAAPPAGAITLLQFSARDVSTERTTSSEEWDFLLVYDDKGRLERAYCDDKIRPDFDYEYVRAREIFTFFRDGAGKVNRIEALYHRRWRDNTKPKEEEDKEATRIVYAGVPERAPRNEAP